MQWLDQSQQAGQSLMRQYGSELVHNFNHDEWRVLVRTSKLAEKVAVNLSSSYRKLLVAYITTGQDNAEKGQLEY